MPKEGRPLDARKPLKVVIDSEGMLTAIYSDELVEAGLFKLGEAEVYRASSVEPEELGGWNVTISDRAHDELGCEGINELACGSFRLRQEALAAEVAWLEERLFT